MAQRHRASPSEPIERPLPQNIEAERSVLAAVLFNNQTLSTSAAILTPDDFFHSHHGLIFSQMLAMQAAGTPINLVSLAEELGRRGKLADAGGAAYLASLEDGRPHVTPHTEHNARIVKEKARDRRKIALAELIKELSFSGSDARQAVSDLAELENDTDCTRSLFDTAQEFEETAEASFSINGLLQNYAVTALAGPSGHGKTWVSLNIVHALLFGPGMLWGLFEVTERAEKVVYFIPEASRTTFKTRLQLMHLYDEIGKRLFVRTLSKGPALPLTDKDVLRAVEGAHVVCDTAIRFMRAVDENSASEAAQGLSDDFFALQRAGAKTIIPLFHSPKSFATQTSMSLENMIRGTSEFGAVLATGWGLRQIDKDSNTIHVENIKDRDFQACQPFQLSGRPFIDQNGQFNIHSAPGECGNLAEYLEGRNRGGAPYAVKEARAANIELLRGWLDKEPNLSSRVLSERFAAIGIKLCDSAVRKYKKALGL